MGVFDAVTKGLDAVGSGLDRVNEQGKRLLSNALWRRIAGRAGDVVDSRRGTVRWVADPSEHCFDITNPDLPPTRVVLRLQSVTAHVGTHEVDLRIGKRAVRRATFSASADLGEHHYLLRQTGRRRARFERDGDVLATLGRPRRGSRVVDWASSSVDDDEIALAHALAVHAGIGAPGAIANILSNVSP